MEYGCGFDSMILLTYGLPIWLIVRVITLFIRKKSGKKILIGKEIMTNIFAVYCLFLIGVTLFPIEIGFGAHSNKFTLQESLRINIIPFKDYIEGYAHLDSESVFYFYFFRSILGNLILLSPFIGYLLMYKKQLRKIKNVTLTSFSISLSIEFLQLLENITNIGTRTVNIDDLIFNTLSGLLAFFIFKLIYKTKLRTYLNME